MSYDTNEFDRVNSPAPGAVPAVVSASARRQSSLTCKRFPMSKKPATDNDSRAAPPTSPAVGNDDVRATRTPLTPAHVGASIGEDADPEQDVAPNLGGEEQMQDA